MILLTNKNELILISVHSWKRNSFDLFISELHQFLVLCEKGDINIFERNSMKMTKQYSIKSLSCVANINNLFIAGTDQHHFFLKVDLLNYKEMTHESSQFNMFSSISRSMRIKAMHNK